MQSAAFVHFAEIDDLANKCRVPSLVSGGVGGQLFVLNPPRFIESVKTTEVGGDARGYDGGKKIKGRKRHLLVDTLGLLLAVTITAANADDGTTAPQLLSQVEAADFPRLNTIFGDNKYHNHALNRWLRKHRPDWTVTVQKPPRAASGQRRFTPVKKRWVVERSNAWHLGTAAAAATAKTTNADPNRARR